MTPAERKLFRVRRSQFLRALVAAADMGVASFACPCPLEAPPATLFCSPCHSSGAGPGIEEGLLSPTLSPFGVLLLIPVAVLLLSPPWVLLLPLGGAAECGHNPVPAASLPVLTREENPSLSAAAAPPLFLPVPVPVPVPERSLLVAPALLARREEEEEAEEEGRRPSSRRNCAW